MNNIAVFGSTGSIGKAITELLASRYPMAEVHAISRSDPPHDLTASNITHHKIDLLNEEQLQKLAQQITQNFKLDFVLVATGTLHDKNIKPEKSLRHLSADNFNHLFTINTILPSIIAKHFIPYLNKNYDSQNEVNKAVFAVLTARVGSITDNKLGGWYAYRASKAALNMIIKTASIETKRTNPKAVIVGLHPGTVNSNLSKPFQKNVPDGKLFTPTFSAKSLIKVVDNLTIEDTGKFFGWDELEIKP